MKPTLQKRRIQRMCVLVLMLIFTSITFAYSSSKSNKSKKEQLNEEFRNIAEEMRDAYENGDLNKVIDLYTKNCCKEYGKAGKGKAKAGVENKRFKKVTKEIRASIYQWVLLSYTALDRPDLGDIFLKRLLILRRNRGTGDYWLSIRSAANNKYYVAPRLRVGLKVGITLSKAHQFKRYSILQSTGSIGEGPIEKDYIFNFPNSMGTQAAAPVLEYALTKNLSASIQPQFSELKFQYKNSLEWKEGSEIPVTADFTHLQKLYYIEIATLLKYQLVETKLKPYLQIGAFYRSMIAAFKAIDVDLPDAGETGKAVNIKNLIARSNIGLCIGAGIGFNIKIENLSVIMEIGVDYKRTLNNIVNEDHRFENNELMYGYYDIFDDMKLSNLDLSMKVFVPISFKVFRR